MYSSSSGAAHKRPRRVPARFTGVELWDQVDWLEHLLGDAELGEPARRAWFHGGIRSTSENGAFGSASSRRLSTLTANRGACAARRTR